MRAIKIVTIYKAFELCTQIDNALDCQRYRVAGICCRTLLEDAVTLRYYLVQSVSKLQDVVNIPPSTFRFARFRKLCEEQNGKYNEIIQKICDSNVVWRKCFSSRRLDIGKSDVFTNPDLDKHDPLFQKNVLSIIQKMPATADEITFSFMYALLCDVTHPNVGALGLYADEAQQSESRQQLKFRKNRQSEDILRFTGEILLRPTVESIGVLECSLSLLQQEIDKLVRYIDKIRTAS